MIRIPTLTTARIPYDADDPDNYMHQDEKTGGSSIIAWMFIGMFAVATVVGLFFGEESPLPKLPYIHVSENMTSAPGGEPKLYR